MTKSKGTEQISDAQLLSELKEYLSYDPESGAFTWIKSPCYHIKNGRIANSRDKKGYIQIMLKGRYFLAHRLAWLFYYGLMPKDCIDHINGVKFDNRICNLREATNAQNVQNVTKPSRANKTGYLGVSWDNTNKKFKAVISVNGRHKHIGRFTSAEEAYEAYLTKKREYHEFCTI